MIYDSWFMIHCDEWWGWWDWWDWWIDDIDDDIDEIDEIEEIYEIDGIDEMRWDHDDDVELNNVDRTLIRCWYYDLGDHEWMNYDSD